MKFASLPLWTNDRATVAVDGVATLPFPMPGKSEEWTPVFLTPRPFGMPLTQAVEWWWRVFRWSFVATFTDIGPVEITLQRTVATGQEKNLCLPASYTWTGTYDANVGAQVRILTAELVLFPPQGTYLFGTTPPDFGPTDEAYALPASASLPEDRTIYPTVAFRVYTNPMWDIGTEIVGTAASIPVILPPTANYSNHDGTIAGIPWRLGWDGDVAMTSITWTLEPIKWYPWANANGSSPTWNESTGAKI